MDKERKFDVVAVDFNDNSVIWADALTIVPTLKQS